MAKTRARKPDGSARDRAVRIARIADDLKCRDVVVFELGDRSQVAEYFVLATGTSARQLRSTAEEVQRLLEAEFDSRPWGVEGWDGAVWLLMDYVDVVVHLFDGAARQFYDLESIWGDSPRVDWSRTEGTN
jgi:ribosome-associated protein